ncbi:MAG: alpha-L-rhamnosidase C-terminal domain-containing protein [Flavobacteriaceae bacterium]
MKLKTYHPLIITLIALFFQSCAKGDIHPKGLRTDLMRNADYVGLNGKKQSFSLHDDVLTKGRYEVAKVQSEKPLFNWILDDRSQKTVAYQVLVSSNREVLKQSIGDLWDSGKVNTPKSSSLYGGKPLQKNKVYYWKVRYWENEDHSSSYSKPQAFVFDPNTSIEKFSQEPLVASDEFPEVIKKTDGSYFLDFKKAAFAKLKIELNSSIEDSILISVGEMKQKESLSIDAQAGRNIRYHQSHLKLKPGTHWYEIPWPENPKRASNRFMIQMPDYIGEVYPFRFVEVKGYKGMLKAPQVVRTMINYTFDESASSFDSSDEVLNQIWDFCKYSMKATSFCGYYVDGDRERIPYEADAFINQLSHYAVDAEYGIARGSMKHLLFNPTWPTEWTLYNILMAWYDYLYTGDNRFILKYYDELKIKTLMDLSDETGLISTLTGKQTDDFFNKLHKNHWGKNNNLRDIVDWPQAQPPGGYDNLKHFTGTEKEHPGENDGYVYQTYNAVVNALYYGALKIMEKIAFDLNQKEDLILFQTQSQKLKRAYLETFQDKTNGLINDGEDTDHKSQHANMFALTFGLIPEKDLENVVTYVAQKNMSCSVYGSQILLEGLFDYGGAEHAIGLMSAKTERSWYNMIRYGSTITMEAWDKRYKPNLDLNHAWGGAPANIIVRKMMGVAPLTPGAQYIKIHPKIGTLQFASLKTSFITGTVHVECRQTDYTYNMKVNLPGGVRGDLLIPALKGDKKLFINGKPTQNKSEKGYFHLKNFPAGKTSFEVK